MRQRLDLMATFLRLMNFAVFGIGVTLLYLLFGQNIIESIRNQPQAMEQRAYPVGAGSGTAEEEDPDKVVDGIHVASGLVYAEGFDIVRGTCTACHSAKLVTQNRATREGWTEMIRWMQAKQGLWDLGASEPVILDYLATNYAPEEIGRRANLDMDAIKWYVLELGSK